MAPTTSAARRLGLATGVVASLAALLTLLAFLPPGVGPFYLVPWATLAVAPLLAAACMCFVIPPGLRRRWLSNIVLSGGISTGAAYLLWRLPAAHDGRGWVVGGIIAAYFAGPFVGACLATRASRLRT
jgi:hypothetical protein